MAREKISVFYEPNGRIRQIAWDRFTPLMFRSDEYGGPTFWIWPDEEGALPVPVLMQVSGERSYAGSEDGVYFSAVYSEGPDRLEMTLQIHNTGSQPFSPARCEWRLGIDTYMDQFPDWNERFFPTLLRCERTHVWGYLMTPLQDILVIASKDPVASWHHSYARADYGREGGFADTGHRIYTTSLDLLHKGPLPGRHPGNLQSIEPGGLRSFRILLAAARNEQEIPSLVSDYTGAPMIQMDKYTYEYGEAARCRCEGMVSFKSPSGRCVESAAPVCLDEYGLWEVRAARSGMESVGCVYVRRPWRWYLEAAREAALACPQKASTHTESWYGFFSAFLARKVAPCPALDARLEADFERAFGLMHSEHPLLPVEAADPGRIQNSALMISLLVDAYEATGRLTYLERASELAGYLMRFQKENGAYYSSAGVHYTCVIYIAKSMLELWLAEKNQPGEEWHRKAVDHYASAAAAVEELRRSVDDIQTEGEMTFEDGMISCSSLQLGLFALQQDRSLRAPYVDVAETMLRKHRCLEAAMIPDCRMRGATLRFWETMYDVMIPQNMMTSPHGWTAWKVYATYYLYLLTGRKQYLQETMDTLGTCMQLVEAQSGRLRWAFVTDPYVEADVFVEDPLRSGRGRMERQVIGEQYVDMVSGWWRAPADTVIRGYAFPGRGIDAGAYQGGACDNDVHECFKCLEEVALCRAFVHQDEEGFLAYNCCVEKIPEGIRVNVSDEQVREVLVYLEQPVSIELVPAGTVAAGEAGFNRLEKGAGIKLKTGGVLSDVKGTSILEIDGGSIRILSRLT